MPRPVEPAHQADGKIELNDARDMLLAIVSKVQALNGTPIPEGRDRPQALAPIHKELLYLAHLCDRTRVAINDEYHRTRGFTEWTDGSFE